MLSKGPPVGKGKLLYHSFQSPVIHKGSKGNKPFSKWVRIGVTGIFCDSVVGHPLWVVKKEAKERNRKSVGLTDSVGC